MKRIKQCLLLVGVWLPLIAAAQSREVVDSLGQRYLLKAVKSLPMSFTPQHEFRINIGAYPIFRDNDDMGGVYWLDDYRLPGLMDKIEQAKVYYGPEYTTGALSLAYYYRLSRRISLGAAFSYTEFARKQYSVFDRSQVGRRQDLHFALLAQCRVMWGEYRWGQVYSSMALGPVFHRERHYDSSVGTRTSLGVQVTFVGLTVGRRFFGFAELGAGVQGTMIAGVGYKFNTKSKK